MHTHTCIKETQTFMLDVLIDLTALVVIFLQIRKTKSDIDARF